MSRSTAAGEAGTARRLLLFPCNGNAVESLDCVAETYSVLGFVDDTAEKQGRTICGHTVFARSALREWPDAAVLAVPGSQHTYTTRRETIEGLGIADARWARAIHPSARVSPLARIGHNVVVMAGAVITSNAVIGNHVCIMPNTVIHHDTFIGDWTLIGANVTVAGYTRIGENCYIGSGSSIINGIEIHDRTLVGLGSTVIRSTPPGSRVAGNPSRPV